MLLIYPFVVQSINVDINVSNCCQQKVDLGFVVQMLKLFFAELAFVNHVYFAFGFMFNVFGGFSFLSEGKDLGEADSR